MNKKVKREVIKIINHLYIYALKIRKQRNILERLMKENNIRESDLDDLLDEIKKENSLIRKKIRTIENEL